MTKTGCCFKDKLSVCPVLEKESEPTDCLVYTSLIQASNVRRRKSKMLKYSESEVV